MPSTDRPAQRRKTEPSSRQQQQSTHASVSPNKQQPSSIPSNILDHIMSFVSTSPSVLNNLSRANKELYLKAIPFLYRTLKLNATNITRTFHGIKNSLDMESDDDVTRPKPTTFGTDLLSIHRRKVYCLQHTRTLIIDDWPGARAAAIALGLTQTIANTRLKDLTQNCWKWNVSEQPPRHWFDLPDTAKNAKQDPHRHHLKIFQRVERISIGQELLSSKLFVPEGYHADDDKMAVHPVIRTLLWALTPRHLCLDHLGLCKEDPMALLFMYPYKRKDRNFRRLIDQWQLKSLSWHTIPYHHLSPPIAGHPFLIQIFCNSCEGKGFKPDVGCINCRRLLKDVAATFRKDIKSAPTPGINDTPRRQLQCINLPCYGTITADAIQCGGQACPQERPARQGSGQDDRKMGFRRQHDEYRSEGGHRALYLLWRILSGSGE